MTKYLVVYRPHVDLNMETQYIGPFDTESDAYDYLCALPALGVCPEGENPGVKFIDQMTAPRK